MAQKEFDENDAIQFMRNHVDESLRDKYTSDDLLLLIDALFDYYEENDDDDDFDPTLGDIVAHVAKQLRKDPDNVIMTDDIKEFVEAELRYELSLEDD